MKEITELSTKISFSLDEIDVLGNQKQVAMALQQFHQVDLLQHEKKEKEVIPFLTHQKLTFRSVSYGTTTTQADHNQNYKSVMSVEHTYHDSTTTDVSPTISLEKYFPSQGILLSEILIIDAFRIPDDANGTEENR
jgi:hypothetical protein